MAVEVGARPRDSGPRGTLLIHTLALLLGAAVAVGVSWDATYGHRFGVRVFGEQPPLVNDLPFLLTLIGYGVVLGASVIVGALVRAPDLDRPILALLAFSLLAEALPGLNYLAQASIFGLLLARGLRRGDIPFPLTPIAGMVCLIYISYAVTMLKSDGFGSVIQKMLFTYMHIFMVILIPGLLRTRRQLEVFGHYLILAACVSVSVEWVQLALSQMAGYPVTFHTGSYNKVETPFGIYPRLTGLMGHPNHLSNSISSVAVLTLWFATRPKELISRQRRTLLLVCYFYFCAGVLASWSRSGWLSLGTMSLLIPLIRWPRFAPMYLGVLLLVGGLAVTSGAAKAFYEMARDLNESSADFRWHIDEIAIRAFDGDPWTGVGVGGIVDYLNPYQLQVHDAYLQLASEMGLFGIATIGGLVLILYTRLSLVAIRGRHVLDRDWAAGMLLASGITLIQCLFDMFLWASFLWAVLAIMETVIQISKNQTSEKEPADLIFLPPLRPKPPTSALLT